MVLYNDMSLILKPAIVEKIEAKHGVSVDEVHEAISDPKRLIRRTKANKSRHGNKKRYMISSKDTGWKNPHLNYPR
jgi:uncharacterized DUF497 family protein